MARVQVVGTGIVPFTRRNEEAVDVLAARAVQRLLGDVGFDGRRIGEVYVGSAKGGGLIGQRALRFAGLGIGLPVFNVENACASSAVAFHLAHRAIESGVTDCALVVGVDRLSTLPKGPLPVQETEWDGQVGVTNPVVYALRAQRYLHESDATVADLARVSVKSRAFASANPAAQMRVRVTVDEVLGAPMVADPLTLPQCSPKSD